MFFKKRFLKFSRNSNKILSIFNIFLNLNNNITLEFLGIKGFLKIKYYFFIYKRKRSLFFFNIRGYGFLYSLIYNLIKGLIYYYEKKLVLLGGEFKAVLKCKHIYFYLSYSHPIIYKIPKFIKIKVISNEIILIGIDKQKIGEICLIFKNYKKFNIYKNKGIKNINDKIILKQIKKK